MRPGWGGRHARRRRCRWRSARRRRPRRPSRRSRAAWWRRPDWRRSRRPRAAAVGTRGKYMGGGGEDLQMLGPAIRPCSLRNREALLGQVDGRLEQLGPRQPPVLAVRHLGHAQEIRGRPRRGRRPRPSRRHGPATSALRNMSGVAAAGAVSAAVVGGDLARLRRVVHEKGAAADPRGLRARPGPAPVPAAMAASIAPPPALSIASPASAASGWAAAIICLTGAGAGTAGSSAASTAITDGAGSAAGAAIGAGDAVAIGSSSGSGSQATRPSNRIAAAVRPPRRENHPVLMSPPRLPNFLPAPVFPATAGHRAWPA